MYGDKMKKILLVPILLLISFLFCNCSTVFSILYGSTKYYDYDFVNKKNKTVKIGKGKWDSPEIIMDNIKFLFSLSFAGSEGTYGKDIVGGKYYPWISIDAPKGKYIDNVLINRVIIYAGEIEYSMLERIQVITIYTKEDYFSIREGEEILDDIIRTGIIDYTIFSDDEYTFDIRGLFITFHAVPIDFTKHKEITLLFDISVKYTTGEEIIINQELVGLLKMERMPRFNYFYIPIFSE
jgi:hypothetical protein